MNSTQKLTIEQVATQDLVSYVHNAKKHPAWQIDQIAESITNFGMNDPIAVWTNKDKELEIVEGHGRLLACQQLGIEQVPVIRLDHLSDNDRRAYVHIHNQLTMNTGFNIDVLDSELSELDCNWEAFGFSVDNLLSEDELDEFFVKAIEDNNAKESNEQQVAQSKQHDSAICKTTCPYCGRSF